MKRNILKLLFTILLAFSFSLITATPARAAAISSNSTGNWDAGATWVGGVVPVAGDTVTIAAGHMVTIPSGYAAAAATITINANSSATQNGLSFTDSTSSLVLTGAITMNAATASPGSLFAVDAGTLSGATTLAIPGAATATWNNIFRISTGTANFSGAITFSGTAAQAQLTFTGAGTLNLGGNLSTGGTFTASTGTVNYNAAGAQTVGTYTYNNLTLSGSGAKTTTTVTVNGILSMEETATASVAPTYGAAATLQYNTATARTAGATEWITPFAASGGVIIANTGTITMNAAKVFNASVPLTINSGATLATNDLQLTFGGNFVNNGGTFTAGSSAITIASTMVTQSIAGFTTTGTVSMTKTVGTATFTGNVNGAAFTLSGLGGTLDLGAGLTHTFTGTFTRTNGTLLGNSSTLNLNGTTSGTVATFTAGTSTVTYGGTAAQTIANVNYYNLGFTGARTTTSITINGAVGVAGTLTNSATFTTGNFILTGSTFNFNGTGAQTVISLNSSP